MTANASVAMAADDLSLARERIDEAISIQEMAWRTSNDNEEDFDMLKNACHVTFRLLSEAADMLKKEAKS